MLHTPCTPCTLYRRLSDYNMASVPVGAGRYSIVYPATEVATGRGVMVKVLRDSVHWKVQRYVSMWYLGGPGMPAAQRALPLCSSRHVPGST
jgi:hypothetical protein